MCVGKMRVAEHGKSAVLKIKPPRSYSELPLWELQLVKARCGNSAVPKFHAKKLSSELNPNHDTHKPIGPFDMAGNISSVDIKIILKETSQEVNREIEPPQSKQNSTAADAINIPFGEIL